MSNQNNQRNHFMQKHFQTTALASALLLSTLTSPTAQAKTASEVYEQAAKSTVVVANFDAQGKQKSMGSGVVMPDGDVVTNCHVVKGATRLTVRVGQTERPANLRYSDWDRDVCSLSSNGLNAPAATVGSSKSLKVGAKVYAIGAPKGLELTLSDGIVSSLRELDGGQYIQTTAAISPGSSGGGLYDDNGALVGLTTFYFSEGQSLNFAVPIDWVKELPKRSAKIKPNTETPINWLAKAMDLEDRKDFQGSLAHALTWTRAQPNNAMSWFSLGAAYGLIKQYQKAIDAYQKALSISPEDAEAWSNLGVAYREMKQYQKAIDAYQQALRINPDYADAWFNLSLAYSGMKQYQNAIDAVQKALRINPEDPKSWYNLGDTYRDMKQYTKAIDAYQQALRINSDYADAWFNLGLAYAGMNQDQNSIDAFQKGLRIKPEEAVAWYNLGVGYDNNKQYAQSINAYQQAIRIDAEYALAWNNLGIVYYLNGERVKVMEVYKKLRVLDPARADKYFNALILPKN